LTSEDIRFDIEVEDLLERSLPEGFYPVSAEVPADLLTPVAAYLKIGTGSGDSFLLESVEGGENIARYSFLGRDPFLRFRARGDEVRLDGRDGSETRHGDPIGQLRDTLDRYRRPAVKGLPRFAGGAVGFFSYDTVRYLESIPSRCEDDLGLADIDLGFFDTVLAFDHLRHRILIIAHVRTGAGEAVLRRSYEEARLRIGAIARLLEEPVPEVDRVASAVHGDLRSNFTRPAFEAAVERAQEHIRAGDIFQVVLSQRFEGELDGEPFSVYRALRRVNPSPYMYFLTLGDCSIIGASPEMLARVEDGTVQTRPIAGTRRRGSDDDEDRRLAVELLADEKERAEHLMLVDLGRNDVGRVAQPGSVQVTEFMQVEKYSHVMHLVSNVRGALRPGIHPLDAFLSCFPAGTVSGAPKVRAMQIIEALEPHRRGPYAGAIGYIDFGGAIDSCITIRTLIVRGGRAYLQVGAGIVADSVPEREFQETESKAAVLLQILAADGEVTP
jgi:anthranilate synthase component 1